MHAFISHPQAQHGMLSSLHQLGPAGGGGGPFSVAPLGSGGGWIWAAALLLAARMGRVTAQEARLDVRQLQVGGLAASGGRYPALPACLRSQQWMPANVGGASACMLVACAAAPATSACLAASLPAHPDTCLSPVTAV